MKKYSMFISIVVVTVCILGGCFFFNVLAEEPAEPEMISYYTYIEIQPGDTLWSIARTYSEGTDITTEEYIRRLKQMNHIGDDIIHEGHYLTIMYQKPREEIGE